MPPPATPRRSLDPRQAIGFGRKLYSDYFNVPKGAAFDKTLPVETREILLEEDLIQREREDLRRSMEAEDEANLILDTAPQMSDEDLVGRINQSPRVFASPQFPNIQAFLESRKQAKVPNPKSDEVLFPIWKEKLTDPALIERANQLKDEGLSFDEIKTNVYRDQQEQQTMLGLLQGGVPQEEIDVLRREGRLTPVEAAKRIALETQKRASAEQQAKNADKEFDLLQDALRRREAVHKINGTDPLGRDEKGVPIDPVYDSWFNRYNQEVERRLYKAPPHPGEAGPYIPAGAKAVDDKPVVVVPEKADIRMAAFAAGLTPEEAEEQEMVISKEAQAQEEVARAWTMAKKDLEAKIFKVYPDDGKRGSNAELLARAVYTDKMEPMDTPPLSVTRGDMPDSPPKRLYATGALAKMGLKPQDPAFKEPGKARGWWAGQNVTNLELLKVWAEEYLKAKGLLQTGPADQPAAAPQSDLQAQAEEIVKRRLPKPNPQ